LVTELNHAEALAGWEERQARLRGWQGDLSAGVIAGPAREALWADVESLRVRGWAQWVQRAELYERLAEACRRVGAIVDGCREWQAAIRAMWQIPAEDIEDVAAQQRLPAAARDDLVANQKTACEQIAAETRWVLDLHEVSAGFSVAELWGALAEQN
jgi:hypothetical protein